MTAPTVLVRCDGGARLGMGHVSRCLALAQELRESHQRGVVFAMRDPASSGVSAVRAAGYDVLLVVDDEDADYGPSLLGLAAAHDARVLVVDVRDNLSRASLDAVRASGVRVVGIDDGTARRLATDLMFYPPVPQVQEMDWTGYRGQYFAGWEWVLLKRDFCQVAPQPAHTVDVLVTMGGSDPAGMTELALEALNLLPQPQAIEVVIGPAFTRAAAVAAVVERSKHAVRVSQSPATMAPLMRASRVALSAFGVSAYELAACGVPAAHLCLTADHARSSSAFVRAQIAECVGVVSQVRPEQIAAAVDGLLADPRRCDAMATRARSLVDGRGASRIAALVVAGLA